MKSLVVKRSVMINRHKTSVSLEEPFWCGLKEIAPSEGVTLPKLLAKIAGTRERDNLSSATRLFVLDQVRTNRMLRLTAITLMLAVALTTSYPTTAYAGPPPPIIPPIIPPPLTPIIPPKPTPIIPHGTSGAAGAAATAGFIGFVAVLVGYDLVRRTTCIGDPWRLGGPGFTTPITPASGNVMIPQCPIVKKQPAVRARG
jgi:predicted DNA-binding ribbon-helix-helix protein